MSKPQWRKSTHSNHERSCVEVAENLPHVVAVRDSKTPDKGHIAIPIAAFTALVKSVRE